jgi:hypothetical protein
LRMTGGKFRQHADRLGSLTREQENAAHTGDYSQRAASRERHDRLL